MNYAKRIATTLLAVAVWISPAPADDKGSDQPGKRDLAAAEHYLKKFEQQVALAKGQPIKPRYEGAEAIKRVAALHKKYPDHPKVKELFERTRKALVLSKGKTLEITPDMLRYRQNEKKLKALFAGKGDKELAALKASVQGTTLEPFPVPSHREVDAETLIGKHVILENFEYPANEFTTLRGQYVFIGSGAKGFYYVELGGRPWRGAYEAIRRYRMLINRDFPENGKWTLVGKITGLDLLVPQAGKKKTEIAHWGWSVEPVALYVPGCTLAVADTQHDLGGSFAGEAEMEKIKGAMYTIRSIPDDVTPEKLTEIYATAIKEKNYPLFLECIDPERRKTPRGLSRINYHWEWHQHRFATFYCHVVVGPATIRVIKGFDSGESLEDIFLTDKDKAKIKKHAEPLVETAELKTKAFDERGRQYGSEKPRFFKRVEKKRWYITNYPQPF